jgi:hypothetical protein
MGYQCQKLLAYPRFVSALSSLTPSFQSLVNSLKKKVLTPTGAFPEGAATAR